MKFSTRPCIALKLFILLWALSTCMTHCIGSFREEIHVCRVLNTKLIICQRKHFSFPFFFFFRTHIRNAQSWCHLTKFNKCHSANVHSRSRYHQYLTIRLQSRLLCDRELSSYSKWFKDWKGFTCHMSRCVACCVAAKGWRGKTRRNCACKE